MVLKFKTQYKRNDKPVYVSLNLFNPTTVSEYKPSLSGLDSSIPNEDAITLDPTLMRVNTVGPVPNAALQLHIECEDFKVPPNSPGDPMATRSFVEDTFTKGANSLFFSSTLVGEDNKKIFGMKVILRFAKYSNKWKIALFFSAAKNQLIWQDPDFDPVDATPSEYYDIEFLYPKSVCNLSKSQMYIPDSQFSAYKGAIVTNAANFVYNTSYPRLFFELPGEGKFLADTNTSNTFFSPVQFIPIRATKSHDKVVYDAVYIAIKNGVNYVTDISELNNLYQQFILSELYKADLEQPDVDGLYIKI